MNAQPREVQNFRFKEIRKIRVFNSSEEHLSTQEPKNLITVSSRFGLIFVGCPSGFKILNFNEVIDFSDSKDLIRVEIKEYPHRKVKLPDSPSHISLSCDDLSLVVCIIKDSVQHALVYDVRTFADSTFEPDFFIEIRLSSSPSVTVTDIIWNPKINNMLATCLSDGSVSVYEFNESVLKICATLPPGTSAQSICWSPKGKQLIIGKRDGTLVQHKPNLQEVRKISAPDICENPVSVLNVIWLSSFSFAVTYIDANNSEERPNLMIVNAPKSGNPVFISYDDICYSSGGLHKPFYSMIHQQEWGLILCTSSNSMEVGVMGLSEDKNSWEQWILEDSGRAEFPLEGKNEMYPIGMALSYNSTKAINFDETQVFPPMPVLLMLSTQGILCPFHMINIGPEAVSLTKHPEILSSQGQKRRDVPRLSQGSITIGTPLSNTSKNLHEMSLNKSLDERPQIMSNKCTSAPSLSHAITNISSNKPTLNTVPAVLPTKEAPASSLFNVVSPPFSSTPKTVSFTQSHFQNINSESFSSPLINISQSSKLNQPNRIGSSAFQPTPAAINKNANLVVIGDGHLKSVSEATYSGKSKRIQEKGYSPNNIFTATILEEMNSFNKELQALKLKTSQSSYLVGTPEELLTLKQSLEQFQKFSADIKDLTKELDQEIHSLRLKMLEAFTTIEENKMLQQRNNDFHYRQLLKSRCLDSNNSKKMKAIWQLYHYVQSQIREVHYQLDEEWNNIEANKTRRLRTYLPFTEAIYQSLLNTQNVIAALPYKLDELQESINLMKFNGFLPSKLKSANTLVYKRNKSSLEGDINDITESMEKTKLQALPAHWKQKKMLSPSKESQLRNLLGNRLVTPVRSSAPGNLSRLVIPDMTVEQDFSHEMLKPASSANNSVLLSPPTITSVPYSTTFRPVAMAIPPQTGGGEDGLMTQKSSASQLKNQISSSLEKPSIGIKNMNLISVTTGISLSTNIEPVSRSLFTTNQMRTSPEVKPITPSLSESLKEVSPTTGSIFTFTATSQMSSSFINSPSPFTFGNKFSSANVSKPTVFSTNSTKTTPITSVSFGPVTSVPLFTLGTNKNISTFQFKPVDSSEVVSETKSPPVTTFNFSLKNASKTTSSESLSKGAFSFGSNNLPGIFQFGTANTLQTVGEGDSVHSPVNKSSTEDNTITQNKSRISHLILEDVTPPSTPIDSSIRDDVEENDKVDDENVVEGGVIIEEITDEKEEELNSNNDIGIAIVRSPEIQLKDVNSFGFISSDTTEGKQSFLSTVVSQGEPKEQAMSMPPPSSAHLTGNTLSIKNFVPSSELSEKENQESVPSVSSAMVKNTLEISSTQDNSISGNTVIFTETQPIVSSYTNANTAVSDSLTDSSKSAFIQSSNIITGFNKSTSIIPTMQQKEPQSNVPISSVVKSPLITAQSVLPISSIESDNIAAVSSVSSTVISAKPDDEKLQVSPGGDFTFTQQNQIIPSGFGIKPDVTEKITTPGVGTITGTTTSVIVSTASITTSAVRVSTVSTVVSSTSISTTSTNPTMNTMSFEKRSDQPSLFGNRSAAPSFSFAQSSPGFGTFALPAANTTSTPSLFGSPPTNTSSPLFGSSTTNTSTSTLYGQQPAFGQTTFGSPSVFGQNSNSAFAQSKSAFGQTNSSMFNQSSNSNISLFGNPATTGSTFSQGTGGFFSGLGGKPNPENANKNVFGGTSSFGSPSTTNNLFGNQSSGSFGSRFGSSSAGGSFSSGGNSVSQAGFGGFQFQEATVPKIGATGFGNSGFSFASPQHQTFGSSPTFGTPQPTLGSFSQTSNFAGFANSDSPTFGSLAAQTSPPFGQSGSNLSFGSPPPPPPPNPPSGFGNSSFGSNSNSTFGGSGFGSSSPSGSSFQQWRS